MLSYKENIEDFSKLARSRNNSIKINCTIIIVVYIISQLLIPMIKLIIRINKNILRCSQFPKIFHNNKPNNNVNKQ